MVLFVQKANELISQGLSYEEVVAALKDYLASTKLLFVLARVDNLVKNGRLKQISRRRNRDAQYPLSR